MAGFIISMAACAAWATALLALLHVVSAADNCHHLLAEFSENPRLESPNYPFDYPSNVRECWVIHSHSQSLLRRSSSRGRVLVEVKAFSLEFSTPKCIADSLEIRDRDSNGPLLGELCGYIGCGRVASSSDKVFLNFRTDSADEKTGFSITYRHIGFGDQHYNSTTWESLPCEDEAGGGSGPFSSWRVAVGVAILLLVVAALVVARVRRCFGGGRSVVTKLAPTKGVVMVPMQTATTGQPGHATQVQYCPNTMPAAASAPPAGLQLLAPAS